MDFFLWHFEILLIYERLCFWTHDLFQPMETIELSGEEGWGLTEEDELNSYLYLDRIQTIISMTIYTWHMWSHVQYYQPPKKIVCIHKTSYVMADIYIDTPWCYLLSVKSTNNYGHETYFIWHWTCILSSYNSIHTIWPPHKYLPLTQKSLPLQPSPPPTIVPVCEWHPWRCVTQDGSNDHK